MRIIFITDNFPPEVNAPASRTYDHCREWVKAGVDVTVITCHPNFPQGKIFKGYKNRLRSVEFIDDIRVIRVWSYMSPNQGVIRRTIDYISYSLMATIFGTFEKCDVIIATSPQFFTTWCGWFLSKLNRKPWVFELRDLWPESIVAVGALRKESFVIRLLEKIEVALYKSSSVIVSNSPAFKKKLTERGICEDKIEVVPNGANLDQFKPTNKNDLLRKKLKLKGKFVVGYIGTHGLAHSLGFILESIAYADFEDVHFLFIGDGAEKKNMVKLSETLHLRNVTFLDSVQKHELANHLALLDVSLVPLKKSDTFKTVIPSKIFEACAMGIPILLGVEGQAKEIIDEFDAGVCFEPENRESFISAVGMLKTHSGLHSRLSSNALKLAEYYDRKKMAKKMLQILESVC